MRWMAHHVQVTESVKTGLWASLFFIYFSYLTGRPKIRNEHVHVNIRHTGGGVIRNLYLYTVTFYYNWAYLR